MYVQIDGIVVRIVVGVLVGVFFFWEVVQFFSLRDLAGHRVFLVLLSLLSMHLFKLHVTSISSGSSLDGDFFFPFLQNILVSLHFSLFQGRCCWLVVFFFLLFSFFLFLKLGLLWFGWRFQFLRCNPFLPFEVTFLFIGMDTRLRSCVCWLVFFWGFFLDTNRILGSFPSTEFHNMPYLLTYLQFGFLPSTTTIICRSWNVMVCRIGKSVGCSHRRV